MKGFLPMDEINFKLLPQRTDSRAKGRIGQHLHPGQKLMVQVVREPFAAKPPTVTTYFSLPGRYLVLMPGADSAGISRKIQDDEQRERLKKMVEELNPPEGFGLIVRTAGVGQSKAELQRDLRYLLRLWDSIQKASRATEFPGLVYRERDLVIRTMRDYFTQDIDEVWIDSQDTYDRALEFVSDVMPQKAKIIKLYSGDRPLFSKFNLEEQIESIYMRRVPLQIGRRDRHRRDRGADRDRRQQQGRREARRRRGERHADQPRGGRGDRAGSCACATSAASSSSTSST